MTHSNTDFGVGAAYQFGLDLDLDSEGNRSVIDEGRRAFGYSINESKYSINHSEVSYPLSLSLAFTKWAGDLIGKLCFGSIKSNCY